MNIKNKETIKNCIAIAILIIIISVVIAIVIKYQVDGEKNMPFELSKITIISTAEGMQGKMVEGEENTKWNLALNQSNDIYLFIDKNENYKKTETIESVTIENINITKTPKKGNIKVYMPNSSDGRRFIYDDAFLVTEKLTYKGATASNEKTLEIGNQGGKVLIRFANTDIDTYKSNDDVEIIHDGTLIAKTNTTNDDLSFSVSFDFIISTGKIKYKANISLELPNGNIIEEGTTQIEKTNLSDIVFKRM